MTPLFLRPRNLPAILCALMLCACSRMSGDPALLAEEFVAAGDTSRAVSAFEQADIDAGGTPALRIRLGELYRSQGTIRDRLLAQHVLERANQLFPHDPDVLTELGRTYYAQTYYPDAEKCLEGALQLDSDNCEAKRLLGAIFYNKWRRVNSHLDDLERARDHLRAAVDCDGANVEAALKHAYALYVLEDRDELAVACDDLVRLFPERAEFCFLRGTLAYDDNRTEDARAEFERGLSLLDANDRLAFDDMHRVLSYRDQDVYDATHPSERELVTRRRWLDIDPDATTGINERHLEHLYRVFVADVYFAPPRSTTRGWDTERGEVFIKFGWPEDIQRSMGDSSVGGRDETWFYPFQTFLFVDERLNGNLRIPYAQDLTLSFLRHTNQAYAFRPSAVPIPGDIDVVTFKDDAFTASIFLAVHVDADSLRAVTDPQRSHRFHFRTTLFSDQWVAESRSADTLAVHELPTLRRQGRTNFTLVRVEKTPFDYYHLACALEDEHGRASAQFRADGDAYRYTRDVLTVSDILLQGDPAAGSSTIVRGSHHLTPNPGHVYGPGQRLSVYFEIYNLATRGGHADYELTFAIYDSPDEPSPTWRRWGSTVARWIRMTDGRQPAMTQGFERRVPRHRSEEEIRIDIDQLLDGRYQLVVTIRDRRSRETAETSTIFEKSSGAEQAQR